MKEDSKQLDCHSLMVYDWVLRDNTPYQIDSLGDLEYLNAYDYKLYPIPITPEILEKNGFEEIPKDKFGRQEYCYAEFLTDIETIDVSIIDNKLNPIYNWTINISNPPVFSGRGFINYVHELQHALRLCKIDKEIEL